MATTIERVVNQALMAAGIRRRIADIYEGSPEAEVALELYGQTRDELQRDKDWQFSRQLASLTLLKGPPPDGGYSLSTPWSNIYPPPGFLYEYSYPTGVLSVRAIIPPPLGPMPDLDPNPALYRLDFDPVPNVSGETASGPPARVILCNTTSAIAVCRGQVTDPTQWEPGFTQAVIEALAAKFAASFEKALQERQLDTVEAKQDTAKAAEVRG